MKSHQTGIFKWPRSSTIFLIFLLFLLLNPKENTFLLSLPRRLVPIVPKSSCYVQAPLASVFLLQSRISTIKSYHDHGEDVQIVKEKFHCISTTPLANMLSLFLFAISMSKSSSDCQGRQKVTLIWMSHISRFIEKKI